MERICSLESALRQRETSLQKLSAQLRSKDVQQSQPHASLDVPRGEFCSDQTLKHCGGGGSVISKEVKEITKNRCL